MTPMPTVTETAITSAATATPVRESGGDHPARRHPSQDAEERAGRAAQQGHQDHRGAGGEEGAGEDDREQAGEGAGELARPATARRGGPRRRRGAARRRGPPAAPPGAPGASSEERARAARGRVAAASSGGRQGRRQGGADPERGAPHEDPRVEGEAAHRQHEVEVVDGAGHQVDEEAAEADPEGESERGAHRAEDGRLEQQRGEDLAAGSRPGPAGCRPAPRRWTTEKVAVL